MSTSEAAKRFFTPARAWDAVALALVAFAVWKMLVAPRFLAAPGVHPAPHAVYARLDGGEFRVADARGRPLFLDFFASWCEPCKIEMPIVQRWSRAHPDAAVVPVDVGEPRAAAAAFARRYALDNVVLDPASSARALFAVEGFPTIVAIDSNGYVRAKWEGLNPAIALALSNARQKL